ncbi:MAG: ribosomal L7Ae/L30e/S12e/Gadd45 family protein [Schwartzia sp.]|nr:ribosomal L7Ae/L30e/S12e/Gadd45 family protein [Schwartzia sp. (in: firmicutes)]
MDEKKIEGLLGMAQRAGKTASGEFAIQKAMAAGRVKALIVAEDASERFKETMMKEAAAKGVPVYTRLTKEELGQCLGKEYRAAVALLDEGFAKTLGEKLRPTTGI